MMQLIMAEILKDKSMAFLLFKVSCIGEFSPCSEILFCSVLDYLSFTLNLQSEVP